MSQTKNRTRSAMTGTGLSIEKPAVEAEAAFSTVPQLAIRWGISERQVWRYVALSDLMATRFGRSVRVRCGGGAVRSQPHWSQVESLRVTSKSSHRSYCYKHS